MRVRWHEAGGARPGPSDSARAPQLPPHYINLFVSACEDELLSRAYVPPFIDRDNDPIVSIKLNLISTLTGPYCILPSYCGRDMVTTAK